MASNESPPVHMGFILLTVSLSAASWACSIMLLVSMYVMVDCMHLCPISLYHRLLLALPDASCAVCVAVIVRIHVEG